MNTSVVFSKKSLAILKLVFSIAFLIEAFQICADAEFFNFLFFNSVPELLSKKSHWLFTTATFEIILLLVGFLDFYFGKLSYFLLPLVLIRSYVFHFSGILSGGELLQGSLLVILILDSRFINASIRTLSDFENLKDSELIKSYFIRILFLISLSFVYFCALYSKDLETHLSGVALSRFFQSNIVPEVWTYNISKYLNNSNYLFLTAGMYLTEASIAALLLISIFKPRVQKIAGLFMCVFHFFIFMVFRIGSFGIFMSALGAALMFIPTEVKLPFFKSIPFKTILITLSLPLILTVIKTAGALTSATTFKDFENKNPKLAAVLRVTGLRNRWTFFSLGSDFIGRWIVQLSNDPNHDALTGQPINEIKDVYYQISPLRTLRLRAFTDFPDDATSAAFGMAYLRLGAAIQHQQDYPSGHVYFLIKTIEGNYRSKIRDQKLYYLCSNRTTEKEFTFYGKDKIFVNSSENASFTKLIESMFNSDEIQLNPKEWDGSHIACIRN